MKKWIVLSAALFSGGWMAQRATAQVAKHVVVVTVDGFRPDFYLDSSWHATHIRSLMGGGTYAQEVNPVFPSMTYPDHTAIVTGVWPAKHGIYYNNMFEPNNPGGRSYWNADSSIKVPTLWGAAQNKGMIVAALLWPVSADAPVKYNIPDIGGMGESVRDKYSKPDGFVDELKKNVFDGAASIEYGKDANVAKIAAYVIKKDRPSLMTIHLFSVDHNEHIQGRDGALVRAAVAAADSAIGIIMDALEEAGIREETVLIVTGDHGFKDVKWNVNPNVWLLNAGLLTDIRKDDWKAQFNASGGSTYLYLKDPKDKETLRQVQHLLDTLPGEEKKLFRVVSRKEMDGIGGNPEVAFALTGLEGASFGNGTTGSAVRPGRGGTHGYFPDSHEIRTGFVANGPGIRAGGVIPVMNERDMAPAIARLLGISFPSAEGKIPKELLNF